MTSGVVIVGAGSSGGGSAVACARAGLSIGRSDHAKGVPWGALAAVSGTPDDVASAELPSASGGTVAVKGDLPTTRRARVPGVSDRMERRDVQPMALKTELGAA